MTTILEIFNMALGHVGNAPVTDPTESAPCQTFYPTARDSCLTWAPWTFSISRQKLVKFEPSSFVSTDFRHQYALPVAPPLLRTVDTDRNTTGVVTSGFFFTNLINGQPFRREVFVDPAIPDTQQPVLLTNAEDVVLQYVGQVSEGIFPPLFTACVALWLATDISNPLSRKSGLRAELFDELQVKLARMTLVDSHQDWPRTQVIDRRYQDERRRDGTLDVPFTGLPVA